MKSIWRLTVFALGLALSIQNARAEDMAVAVKASTLGIGGEFTTSITPNKLNARLQINGFNYSKTINSAQVTYHSKLKLLSVGAIADYYPFSGKFRISGGLYYNGNKFSLTAKPTAAGTFTFNGTTYTTAQVGTANATVDFNKLAPYVGFGWGNAVSDGNPFGMSLEIGALYQGKPKSSITTSKSVPGLSTDLATAKRDLDNSLNNFKLYPVVALGINWRF